MVERGDAKVFPPQKEVGMGGKSVSRAKGREGGGQKKVCSYSLSYRHSFSHIEGGKTSFHRLKRGGGGG